MDMTDENGLARPMLPASRPQAQPKGRTTIATKTRGARPPTVAASATLAGVVTVEVTIVAVIIVHAIIRGQRRSVLVLEFDQPDLDPVSKSQNLVMDDFP